MKVYLVFLVFAFFAQGIHCHLPCFLPMLDFTETPVFRPLIYKLDGTLYPVNRDKVKIVTGEEFIVSCENNFLRAFPGEHNVTVKCEDESLVIKDKGNLKTTFKNLNCDIRVLEDAKHNVEGCTVADGGLYYQYFSSRDNEIIVLAEVCFDYSEDQVKFIKFSYPQDYSKRHAHSSPSSTTTAHKISTLKSYRSDVVRDRIKALLGENYNLVGQTIDGVRLMTKRFVNEQLQDIERYSVTNMAGMWTAVAQGNWENTMKDIEELGRDRKKPLHIIMGAHNILKLHHPEGREVRMFLKDDNKIPVPEYLWTIVHDTEKNQGVAIVTLNNPFMKHEQLKIHEFCSNRCNEITWLKNLRKDNNYDKPIYGYTYCCKIDNFPMYPTLRKLDLLKV